MYSFGVIFAEALMAGGRMHDPYKDFSQSTDNVFSDTGAAEDHRFAAAPTRRAPWVSPWRHCFCVSLALPARLVASLHSLRVRQASEGVCRSRGRPRQDEGALRANFRCSARPFCLWKLLRLLRRETGSREVVSRGACPAKVAVKNCHCARCKRGPMATVSAVAAATTSTRWSPPFKDDVIFR